MDANVANQQFRDEIRRRGLVTAHQVEQAEALVASGDAPDLVRAVIDAGWLSGGEAKRILWDLVQAEREARQREMADASVRGPSEPVAAASSSSGGHAAVAGANVRGGTTAEPPSGPVPAHIDTPMSDADDPGSVVVPEPAPVPVRRTPKAPRRPRPPRRPSDVAAVTPPSESGSKVEEPIADPDTDPVAEWPEAAKGRIPGRKVEAATEPPVEPAQAEARTPEARPDKRRSSKEARRKRRSGDDKRAARRSGSKPAEPKPTPAPRHEPTATPTSTRRPPIARHKTTRRVPRPPSRPTSGVTPHIHSGHTPAPFYEPEDLAGVLLGGRYRIDSLIGRGGSGSVWSGVDTTLDRKVAIKVLPPELADDRQYRDRFLLEARAAARLGNHPHIVPVHTVDRDEERDRYYMVMSLIEGRSLQTLLDEERHGPLQLNEALAVFRQLLSALDHAHSQDVVHRDIKPENILVTGDGPLRVYVTDFGLARLADLQSTLTADGQVMGTPHFMSPEQCAGRTVDGRGDLYSAGCVLHWMLTSHHVFGERTKTAYLIAHLREQPPPLRQAGPNMPAGIGDLINCLLKKRPDDRFADAAAVLAALDAWEANQEASRPARRGGGSKPQATASEVGIDVEFIRERMRKKDRTTNMLIAVAIITAGALIVATIVLVTALTS